MVQTVQGFIRSVTEKKFIAAFAIDDVNYYIVGTFSINVPLFQSEDAVLTFTRTSGVVPSKKFSGEVNETELKLKDGANWSIAGTFVKDITLRNDVSGTSEWGTN